MGVDRFVVTLVDTKQGRQEERRWGKADVSQSMAWLKRMNARGYDVWIRPDGEHGMALLGGLRKRDLHTLRERGFTPAVVVETGREQYQAWVKLSAMGLDESLRSQATAGLVKGLGFSGANAISRADGRLAGFTNQQVLRTDGRHPYVLLTDDEGKLAPAAPAYLACFQRERTKVQELHRDKQHRQSRGPQR
ncbi:DNA-primase RepB domain-containing protein [Duganella hordei]|uniref:DNA-primase RepB domain-containing protein n=1 Tax=Duganella hordei TaxID=2865934 RepID=UPI0033418338